MASATSDRSRVAASTTRQLLAVVCATLFVNAIAVVVAVANGWPAEFDAHNDPHRVSEQWIGSGTAISAPLAPLAILAGCALLVWVGSRWLGLVCSVLVTLVGIVATIGTLGEPTTFHPVDVVEALFHVVGLVLAIALVLMGGSEARRRFRELRRQPESVGG